MYQGNLVTLPLLVLLLVNQLSMISGFRSSIFQVPNLARGKRFLSALKAVSSSTSGAAGTTEFRINFHENDKIISPWHDIPYKVGDLYHFVNEIPKYTKAKMEVATKEANNPIAQDIKKGKLRDYHGPIFWNYGCIPQTWENPNVIHPVVNAKGDNDPLDVVEIGSKALPAGSVHKIKVLGVLAMIDDGELDWKVIAIHSEDPLAKDLHDITDVETKLHGTVSGIREWFRWYKTPDEKPLNAFGFEEKALSKDVAKEIIEETHHYWKDLRNGKTDKGKLWVPSNH